MFSLGKEFLASAIRRMKYYKDLGDKTFIQLNESDFHFVPNDESNSVATIIRHMYGNMMSRWTNFLTEDGEKEWRQRDEEFTFKQEKKDVLVTYWEKGWACFLGALDGLGEDDLARKITIRQEELTVIDAINRQVAHYPYHVGQIIYIAKIIKDKDWKNLSIPKGNSNAYNHSGEVKDPAKLF